MTDKVAPYAKAVIGALIAGLGTLAGAWQDGSLTWPEGITALVAGLVALGAVFRVPNAPLPPS